MLQTMTMNDRNIRTNGSNGATNAATNGPTFALTSVLDGLNENDPIRDQTLIHHLYQSDAMAQSGIWDTAANEACSALDALADALARAVSRVLKKNAEPPLLSNFRSRRRALLNARVIDGDDNEFLAVTDVVGSLRAKHGATVDAAWADAVRRLVHIAATHLLVRYAEWRKNRVG